MSLQITLDCQREDFQLQLHTSIDAQGYTAIYGPSGAGKTTLMRWLAGLETFNGELRFHDHIWQNGDYCMPTQQRQIAYVFQEPRLFPHLTVTGNLQYAWQRRFNDNGPSIERVCDWLQLTPLLTRSTQTLSGGEQQRVAIGRALLSSPQLIFMDEPLSSLDSASKEHILRSLEELQRHLPAPVLYVSHDIREVSRLANELLLLENGQLTAQGSFIELSNRLDLSLSHEENAASVITVTIDQQDPHYHLTNVLVENQFPMFLTQVEGDPGKKLRLRIPAKDVSINLSPDSEQSSILNVLPATIDEIETTLAARALIRLKIGQQFLLARITQKSIDRLQLKPDLAVYAQIKTAALLSEQSVND